MKQSIRFLTLLGVFAVSACAGTHSTPSASAHGSSIPQNESVDANTAASIDAATTPAEAVQQTTDPNAYTIIAGDVLQVTVWKEDGLDRETLVLPDGTINFPLVGLDDRGGQNAKHRSKRT